MLKKQEENLEMLTRLIHYIQQTILSPFITLIKVYPLPNYMPNRE